MNQRYKELATQATDMILGVPVLDQKKFSKLIVKECADIASINAHQYETPGTYVLKHFGVEE